MSNNPVIAVLAVGGAGKNIVEYLKHVAYKSIFDTDYILYDTNVQSLTDSSIFNQIHFDLNKLTGKMISNEIGRAHV